MPASLNIGDRDAKANNNFECGLLEPDRGQIERFVDLIFRHVPEGYISIRAFNADNTVFWNEAVHFNGGGMQPVCDAAEDIARRCAQVKTATDNVVFCPPVAVFKGPDKARQEDLLHGPALSIDFDKHPLRGRAQLEAIIGPLTAAVRSGWDWIDPQTGEVEHKLHGHWRLSVPASDEASLDKLKRARALANAIVGGDTSNDPVSHPLRWPGSWHRKGEPRLCEIVEANPDAEIDLDAALAALEAAAPADTGKADPGPGTESKSKGAEGWGEEIANILAGNNLHDSIAVLAAKLIAAGMGDGAAVNLIRGFMNQ